MLWLLYLEVYDLKRLQSFRRCSPLFQTTHQKSIEVLQRTATVERDIEALLWSVLPHLQMGDLFLTVVSICSSR